MEDLERRLGYRFRDPSLAVQALTHRSYRYEKLDEATPDNERLEFLGDAILGFHVSRLLFERFPERREGDLSRLRSKLVSARSLARRARALGLGRALRLGRGEEMSGGREKDSLLADAFESLLAAVFLDGGSEAAEGLVRREFAADLEAERGRPAPRDWKSQLQETLHASGAAEPRYEVVAESGPDHLKQFEVAVLASGGELGRGRGRSKKSAQQQAALAALGHLGVEIAAGPERAGSEGA